MRQDEEGKREEAGRSRRQERRRKMRTPDEEETELTELRWGHLGPVWVSPWGRFGGLWGCPGVSGGQLRFVCRGARKQAKF